LKTQTTTMSSNQNPETDATTGLLDSSAMRSYLDLIETNMNLSTVRSLALKTIAHPQIFCGFDEFKTCCSQLLSPQQGQTQTTTTATASNSLFNTLDLFSFGSLNDYKKQGESTGQPETEHYLPLNEPALAKLRQLTVLTCIQKACFDRKTRISYDVVAEALGLTTDTMQDGGVSFDTATTTTTAIRDVEDVIVQCLYANVLKGKLCQKTRTFGWQGECLPIVSSRDIPVTLIPSLLSELQGLGRRLEESEIEVTQAQEQVTQGLKDTAQYWKDVRNQKKTTTKDEAFSKGGSNSSGGGGGDGVVARSIFGGNSGGTQGNFWHESSGAGGSGRSRSTKRSRGGMSGSFLMDAGKRI
jgi:hypothetical protein